MNNVFAGLILRYLPAPLLRRRWAARRPRADAAVPAVRQLLVDVSVIARMDQRTGIQRVVRNLFRQLLEAPPAGFRVRAIAATRGRGYRYLPDNFLDLPLPRQRPEVSGEAVQGGPGDLFLGLDLAAYIVHRHAGELLRWKRDGVRIAFMVYDLLPVLEPTWFRPRATRDFRRWLRALAILADDVVCISRSVQRDFTAWVRGVHGLEPASIRSSVIQLGTDPFGFLLHEPARTGSATLPASCLEEKFVLMVGTIEPRKAHAEVLDAFEKLWDRGEAAQLVIVGRQGWMVQALVERLRTHPEAGRRLHWLDAPSDTMLLELYQRAAGLIMASKGEGLGLPVLEAQCWNKPVLARDIAIFREIAGDTATFFSSAAPGGLEGALERWIATLLAQRTDIPMGPAVSWRHSRDQLVRALPELS